MNQPTISDLQAHLTQYLNNTTTLKQFRAWFDQETWGLAAKSDSHTRRLAGEIELRLAELTSGHLTEDELRKLLSAVVPDPSRLVRAR